MWRKTLIKHYTKTYINRLFPSLHIILYNIWICILRFIYMYSWVIEYDSWRKFQIWNIFFTIIDTVIVNTTTRFDAAKEIDSLFRVLWNFLSMSNDAIKTDKKNVYKNKKYVFFMMKIFRITQWKNLFISNQYIKLISNTFTQWNLWTETF